GVALGGGAGDAASDVAAALPRRRGRVTGCRGRPRTPAGREDAPEPRHRLADHRAAANEIPPGQPPSDEFVDDVLLNGPPSPPKIVKPPVVDVHETAGVHDTPLT